MVFAFIVLSGCTEKPQTDSNSTNIQNSNSNLTQEKSKAELSSNLRKMTQAECKQNNYDWVGIPGLCANPDKTYGCGARCDKKTADAGKACHSNSDCEGACLCNSGKTDSTGYFIGECSKSVNYTEVSDCACILQEKTKNDPKVYPYGVYPFGCS